MEPRSKNGVPICSKCGHQRQKMLSTFCDTCMDFAIDEYNKRMEALGWKLIKDEKGRPKYVAKKKANEKVSNDSSGAGGK